MCSTRWKREQMKQCPVFSQMRQRTPKVHCLTNPVTMQDVANVLLAAGGSAVMAQDAAEVEEITALCDATLLNTGVPSLEKFRACALAGVRANGLGHPVVLDPVGAGASAFRRSQLGALLEQVRPAIIRCNQEEAAALLGLRQESGLHLASGGVESGLAASEEAACALAAQLAQAAGCTVLMTGETDVVTDGTTLDTLHGGDARIRRITGGGCMLSALCALFCGGGVAAFDAARLAGQFWRDCAAQAGKRVGQGQIGTFHMALFDAVSAAVWKEGAVEA